MDVINLAVIPGVVTLSAAVVAGYIARSNMVVNKESKVSEFRQAWINSLRDDLGIFLSCARTMTRVVEEGGLNEIDRSNPYLIPSGSISAIRQDSSQTFYKIKLRLNPNQADHLELLGKLEEVLKGIQAFIFDQVAASDALANVDAAADKAAEVLKREWEKVKSGENAYQDALKSTNRSILAGILVAIVLLAIGYFTK